MTDHAEVRRDAEQVRARKCAWCNAPDRGWSNVHILISETGLAFCSLICVEAMEQDCGTDILIVAASGTHAPETFGDIEAAERG